MSKSSPSSGSYGFWLRLLHKLALDYASVADLCFDIEQGALRSVARSETTKPLFIAGLARSGSTALLASIHQTGQFRSLTYRDMPFVLMPSVWRKLSGTKSGSQHKRERAHGDGIFVNVDSPEAFEEVFWRAFCHDDYLHEKYLTPHVVNQQMVEKFKCFVASVLAAADEPRQSRYLSKNNNNILRIPAIKQAFPGALVIVPFRDPVQQSISLMNQHQRFCQLHDKDPFALQYMNWLAHHEFGLGHKPFLFDDGSPDPRRYQPADLNYWLCIWNNSYQHVIKTASADSYFLCFERLCKNTEEEIGRLFSTAQICLTADYAQPLFDLPPAKIGEGADPRLVALCARTYEQMSQQSTSFKNM